MGIFWEFNVAWEMFRNNTPPRQNPCRSRSKDVVSSDIKTFLHECFLLPEVVWVNFGNGDARELAEENRNRSH